MSICGLTSSRILSSPFLDFPTKPDLPSRYLRLWLWEIGPRLGELMDSLSTDTEDLGDFSDAY
jgi:hypothetical protein